MPSRRLFLLLVVLFFCLFWPPAGVSGREDHPAEKPFAGSQLTASKNRIREGDTISYTLTVRANGIDAPLQTSVGFRIPDPAMLVSAPVSMTFNDEERELSWEGEIAPDQDRTFAITLVTLPDSAGSRSVFANAGIYWRPPGREWETATMWLQSETEIHSKRRPVLYVLPGGYGIGTVEVVFLGYLILGSLFILFIPALIMRRERHGRFAQTEETPAAQKSAKAFLHALAVAFVFLVGIAHLIGSIAFKDIRRFMAYQKTSCTLLDKRIVLEEGSSSSRSGGPSKQRTIRYNKPLVAVRYEAGGREITASGMPKPTALLSATDWFARRQLARYERGKSYLCWYDPQEPATFVLSRGISWGWYLLGAIPMLFLYFLGQSFLQRLRGKTTDS